MMTIRLRRPLQHLSAGDGTICVTDSRSTSTLQNTSEMGEAVLECTKSTHAVSSRQQTSSFPTQAETVAGFFGDGADLHLNDAFHGPGRDQFAGEFVVWRFWA